MRSGQCYALSTILLTRDWDLLLGPLEWARAETVNYSRGVMAEGIPIFCQSEGVRSSREARLPSHGSTPSDQHSIFRLFSQIGRLTRPASLEDPLSHVK